MSAALLERANKIKAENKKLADEPVRRGAEGLSSHSRKAVVSPRAEGAPNIEHDLIAFHDRYETYFVGACADKVIAACKALHDKRDSFRHFDEIKAARLYEDLKISKVDGMTKVEVRQTHWNDCLKALEMSGIMVTSTGISG